MASVSTETESTEEEQPWNDPCAVPFSARIWPDREWSLRRMPWLVLGYFSLVRIVWSLCASINRARWRVARYLSSFRSPRPFGPHRLPNEILFAIFEQLSAVQVDMKQCTPELPDFQTLAACCLLSRDLLPVARKELYQYRLYESSTLGGRFGSRSFLVYTFDAPNHLVHRQGNAKPDVYESMHSFLFPAWIPTRHPDHGSCETHALVYELEPMVGWTPIAVAREPDEYCRTWKLRKCWRGQEQETHQRPERRSWEREVAWLCKWWDRIRHPLRTTGVAPWVTWTQDIAWLVSERSLYVTLACSYATTEVYWALMTAGWVLTEAGWMLTKMGYGLCWATWCRGVGTVWLRLKEQRDMWTMQNLDW